MKEIANTASHTLAVDPGKNRIYCTMTGKAELPEISTFFHEWAYAMSLVSSGFSVLNDVSHIQTLTRDWITKFAYIRTTLLKARLSGMAEVFPENLAAKIKSSHIKKIFTNRNDAEVWLDNIDQPGWTE